MKKLIALLSLSTFLAVGVYAQSEKVTSQEAKKETTEVTSGVKDAAKAKSASCCAKPNKACCMNNKDAKNCTPEQKAACAKAGKECSHDHAKAGKNCSHGEAKAVDPKSNDEKAE